MKIAVIGYGKIGGSLAKQWGAAGHQITLGARDPGKAEVLELVKTIGANAKATSIPAAVADAEVVLIAVPGAAVEETANLIGKGLDGKLVIDATNNRGGSGFNNCDKLAAAAPGAILCRAFNTYGFENLADSTFAEGKADIFWAGPDGSNQTVVEQLVNDAGFRPVRIGGIDQVGVVDSIVLLWFGGIASQGGRHFAIRFVK